MSTYTRIAAVTGSNKGIGLACVRNLALQYPTSSINNGPLLIYLTARNQERGDAALKAIHEDSQLKAARALRAHGGLTDIEFVPLDIDSKQSIKDFAATIKKQHPDGIDILINNAGIALDGFNADLAQKTIDCNYFGTLEATRQLLPHVRDGGRIVTVASMAGQLIPQYSSEIRNRLVGAKSVDEVTTLMNEYIDDVKNNTYKGKWPGSSYRVSKAGLIASTNIIAKEVTQSGSKVLINSCCPGYVNTDMSKGNGTRTPDHGARTPVFLALADINGDSAEFWQDEKHLKWNVA